MRDARLAAGVSRGSRRGRAGAQRSATCVYSDRRERSGDKTRTGDERRLQGDRDDVGVFARVRRDESGLNATEAEGGGTAKCRYASLSTK